MSGPAATTIWMVREDVGGSVQHFAHFMMDYYIDVAVWCGENLGAPLIVRDCGPCNVWFDVLPGSPTVTIVSTDELSQRAREAPEHVLIASGHFVNPIAISKLQRFRQLFAGEVVEANLRNRVMATRSVEPAFYASAQSERKTSGYTRRRIANEANVAKLLTRVWSFTVLEFFHVSPRQAISQMSTCSLFIAQRGAAMMNLLFMPAGSTVIEILPKEFLALGRRQDMYRRACSHLGLTYQRILQESKFAPVSLLKVWRTVRASIRSSRRDVTRA